VLPTVKPATAPAECATYDPTAKTRVWAYGTDAGGTSTHNWPAYTIEGTVRTKLLLHCHVGTHWTVTIAQGDIMRCQPLCLHCIFYAVSHKDLFLC
jgi:hypothetical protein